MLDPKIRRRIIATKPTILIGAEPALLWAMLGSKGEIPR